MLKYKDALLYVLFTATSFVFIDKMDDHINPLFSLLVMASLSMCVFLSINYKNFKKMWNAYNHNKTLFLIVNFLIGVNWLCSIFAPHCSDPFIYLTIVFIVTTILGLVFIDKTDKWDQSIHYSMILILVILTIFIFMTYKTCDGRSVLLGLILGGVSLYLYFDFSNKLTRQADLSTTQILAIRFVVLIVGLFLAVTYNYDTMNIVLSYNNLSILFFMTFFTLILPVYFLQKSLSKIGVMLTSIFIGFTPSVTFLLYSFAEHEFILYNFAISLTVTGILVFVKILPKIKEVIIK